MKAISGLAAIIALGLLAAILASIPHENYCTAWDVRCDIDWAGWAQFVSVAVTLAATVGVAVLPILEARRRAHDQQDRLEADALALIEMLDRQLDLLVKTLENHMLGAVPITARGLDVTVREMNAFDARRIDSVVVADALSDMERIGSQARYAYEAAGTILTNEAASELALMMGVYASMAGVVRSRAQAACASNRTKTMRRRSPPLTG
jgi:hypothetical protein